MDTRPDEITRILNDAEAGDARASEQLLPLVYAQLRAIARQRMARERPGHTLQATALVHEAYFRLIGRQDIGWHSRGQFYSAAAEAMRRILIEHARRRGRVKRGGSCRRLPLSVVDLAIDADAEEILAVDEAIRRLGEQDERVCEIVRLRFFAGLSVEQTASALGVSDRTVRRGWALARAWLGRELKPR